jgi:hypothetical protein
MRGRLFGSCALNVGLTYSAQSRLKRRLSKFRTKEVAEADVVAVLSREDVLDHAART